MKEFLFFCKPQSVKTAIFTTSDVFLAQKIQISKMFFKQNFLIIFYYNLANFQVYSSSRTKALWKNVILSYRAFQSPRNSFQVKSARFCPIFSKIQKIFQLLRFFMVYYLGIHEKMTNNPFLMPFGPKQRPFQPFFSSF